MSEGGWGLGHRGQERPLKLAVPIFALGAYTAMSAVTDFQLSKSHALKSPPLAIRPDSFSPALSLRQTRTRRTGNATGPKRFTRVPDRTKLIITASRPK